MMADLLKPLTLAVLVALTTVPAAQAQENGEAGTADATSGLDMGSDVTAERQPGQVYVAEVHGDWERRCAFNPNGEDPCQMYQLLKDSDGTPVAEFNLMRLQEGAQAAAVGTFVAPLETLLTERLTLSVDGGGGKQYAFRLCTAQGCVVQLGLTDDEIHQMKAGNVATASIVPAIAPDQRVNLSLSLTGFTAAYDALTVPVAPQQ